MAEDLQALAVFALVSTGTPGPNNTLLWASGVRFGFRATVPQIAGTALGIGAIALAVAAGVGLVVTAVPGVELALKLAGSAYLLYLAVGLTGAHAFERDELARPLGVRHAIAFQFVNPKAWLFALAAMSAFGPPIGSLLVAAVMTLTVFPTASLWAAGGSALQRYARSRGVAAVLALLLALSVALIWI